MKKHHSRLNFAGKRSSALWCFPVASWLGIFYMIPLVFIILNSFRKMVNYQIVNDFTLDNYIKVFTNPAYGTAMCNSLFLTCKVVLITTVVAYLLALVLKYAVPASWRTFFLVLIIAPFWTSYLIRAYSWFIVLGNAGVINKVLLALGWIEEPLKILYTTKATTIGLIHYLLPLMTLNLFNTMDSIDDTLLEAADDMGAGKFRKFFYIILPLSSGGLCNGLMFIFILPLPIQYLFWLLQILFLQQPWGGRWISYFRSLS